MLNRHTIAGYISVASVALIGLYMIAVAINVISRYGLNAPLAIISDMSEFLVPSALALAFPVAALNGSHLSLRFLGGFIGPKTTLVLDMLGRVATVVLLAVITWQLFRYAQYTHDTSRSSSLRNVPLWPVWAFATMAMGSATIATFFTAPAESPSADDAAHGFE